ncbi:uncharacterized protein N7459_001353 [Penicillium hispanicum]|uniref:uncharacterized protein n=1 Tax=Penicillium hispanicum TaxID=1080232 RepID=UPI0025402BE7|nr:uncharacterized protein N7459_001353 [Penicillium hispanicum]KAJ5595145.1 hypothetical protein N7459_001353 [Penicillium hispanicum]
MSILVTASPQNTTNPTVYGRDELNSDVSRTFLACLQSTGVEYKVYVDTTGVTVVIPATKREIDFDGVDEKLFACIVQVNHRMHVVTESTLYDQDEHTNAVAGNSVTHEWLSEQGANGMKEVGTRPATNSTARGSRRNAEGEKKSAKRTFRQLYFSFPSDWSDCASGEDQLGQGL